MPDEMPTLETIELNTDQESVTVTYIGVDGEQYMFQPPLSAIGVESIDDPAITDGIIALIPEV